MSPYLAMLALPLVLASASLVTPPLDRHSRHRDLARQHNSDRDVHPQLGRRTLEPKAAQVPLGGFEVVGDSGVSAQMMFLGTANTVYILDSTYHLCGAGRTDADYQKPKTIL